MAEYYQSDFESFDVGTLREMLEAHAAVVLFRNTSNSKYVEIVRQRIQDVATLIQTRTGIVRGVVMTWEDDIQPIAEHLFGESLEGKPIGVLKDFTPTVLSGIYGRTRIVSTDEMFGPTIALDLAAEDLVS